MPKRTNINIHPRSPLVGEPNPHRGFGGRLMEGLQTNPPSDRAVRSPVPPQGGNEIKPAKQTHSAKLSGGGVLNDKSRDLRKHATEAERKLWRYLCRRQLEGYKFRRQHPMGGRYIADFVCLERKLIIELDGSQHMEQSRYDGRRDMFLNNEGFRVLRFWNNDVTANIEGVVAEISRHLSSPPGGEPESANVSDARSDGGLKDQKLSPPTAPRLRRDRVLPPKGGAGKGADADSTPPQGGSRKDTCA